MAISRLSEAKRQLDQLARERRRRRAFEERAAAACQDGADISGELMATLERMPRRAALRVVNGLAGRPDVRRFERLRPREQEALCAILLGEICR